jgi:hypothetical protein
LRCQPLWVTATHYGRVRVALYVSWVYILDKGCWRVACGLPKMGCIVYRCWSLLYMGSLSPKSGDVGTPCHYVFGTFRVFSVYAFGLPTGATGWVPIPRPQIPQDIQRLGCCSLWLAVGCFHHRLEQRLLCIRTYGGQSLALAPICSKHSPNILNNLRNSVMGPGLI